LKHRDVNLCLLLACSLCVTLARAQDLTLIERELQQRFTGAALNFEQPYQGKDLEFDHTGKLMSSPAPACWQRAQVESVHLTADELLLDISHPANATTLLMQRGSSPVPPAPQDDAQVQTLHIRSDGLQWDRGQILAALDRIQKLPEVSLPQPAGAQPPPAGSDRRILYFLPDGPVYRSGNGISPPRATHMPDPEYSEAAHKQKVCGTVRLHVVVLDDGSVGSVQSAVPQFGWGLDEKAVETVKQWHFEPAQLEGHPVRVGINVTVTFRMW